VHGLSKERVRCIAEQAGIKRRLRPSKTRCAVPGCDQLAHARGICNRHYQIEYQAPRRAAAAARRAERRVSPERLGSFLRQLREALKVHSTTKMARTCGFSPNYLRLIRTRFYVPSMKAITRIEQILDTLRREEVAWRTLIEWARAQRDRLGVVEFARRMNIPASNLVRVLSGEQPLSSGLAAKLARGRAG
jgi:hypothetical protein